MHWVDRGPEPDGLAAVRSLYTPCWVQYYRDGTATKPTDPHWRPFHDNVGRVFFDLCAYCEETTRGEVDHFRPKSRFPERVYEWSTWVFACHDCNMNKLNKWPPHGYVDPCARTIPARPENFFYFDVLTGEIILKTGLNAVRRQKALKMIDDLRLNAHHHLRARQAWMRAIRENLPIQDEADPTLQNFIDWVADRGTPLSSLTRSLLAEHGYSIDD